MIISLKYIQFHSLEHFLDEKQVIVAKRCEEMINLFADLSKDDMTEGIRHPETNSENICKYDVRHRLDS